MRINRQGWLILGLCLVLLVSLGFNAGQALNRRFRGDDALSALAGNVDTALASLDSAVYMNTNRVDWNDPVFRLTFYKNMLVAREATAASSRLSRLNSGEPAETAEKMGELTAHLDNIYLPAAQRLAAGRATDADKSSLASLCDNLKKAGWPLRAQLRDQGWVKLGQSLSDLLSILGPATAPTPVITVPVEPIPEQPKQPVDQAEDKPEGKKDSEVEGKGDQAENIAEEEGNRAADEEEDKAADEEDRADKTDKAENGDQGALPYPEG